MPYIFQTLRLCILRSQATQRGMGTVGYCAGQDGNCFQLDCNSRERDGNGFISAGRDGTGYDFHSRVPLYDTVHQTYETQYRWIRVRGPWFIQHDTLGHTPCLSRAATSASSQVNPQDWYRVIQKTVIYSFLTNFLNLWPNDRESRALSSAPAQIHWLSQYKTEWIPSAIS